MGEIFQHRRRSCNTCKEKQLYKSEGHWWPSQISAYHRYVTRLSMILWGALEYKLHQSMRKLEARKLDFHILSPFGHWLKAFPWDVNSQVFWALGKYGQRPE